TRRTTAAAAPQSSPPGRGPIRCAGGQKQPLFSGPVLVVRRVRRSAMETTARGWHVLDRESAIAWRQYSFGPGLATTFVFRGAGNGLIGMSPGNGIDDGALDKISERGKEPDPGAGRAFRGPGAGPRRSRHRARSPRPARREPLRDGAGRARRL